LWVVGTSLRLGLFPVLQIAAYGVRRQKNQVPADASKPTGIVVMGRCYAKVAELTVSSMWVAVASNRIAWPDGPSMQVLYSGKSVFHLLSGRSPCLHFTGQCFEVQSNVRPDDSHGLAMPADPDPSPASRYL
jgi:hypothetical protein